jgi:hypothetical protein
MKGLSVKRIKEVRLMVKKMKKLKKKMKLPAMSKATMTAMASKNYKG